MDVLHTIGSIASILCLTFLAMQYAKRTRQRAVERYIESHAPGCGVIPQEGVLIQVGFCARCGDDFLWLGLVTYTPNYWGDQFPWLQRFAWMNRGVVRKVLTYNWAFHRCPDEIERWDEAAAELGS